jgi:AhpC/TSA family
VARIQVGDQAPDFTLPSQSGEPVRLSDRLGDRVVVLYFYPKDDTPAQTVGPAVRLIYTRPAGAPRPRANRTPARYQSAP